MDNIDNNISEHVLKVKKRIETEELSIKELKNYFNNILQYPKITDIERELLVNAVEKQIRVKFPNNAKKILGGKSAKAQELLEEIYKDLTQEFDWSNNNVRNKVKVCGSMISGKEYICWYISYKNDNNYSAGFAYKQMTPEQDPYLEIDYRKVGKGFEDEKKINHFRVELKDDAIKLFKEHLSKIIL